MQDVLDAPARHALRDLRDLGGDGGADLLARPRDLDAEQAQRLLSDGDALVVAAGDLIELHPQALDPRPIEVRRRHLEQPLEQRLGLGEAAAQVLALGRLERERPAQRVIPAAPSSPSALRPALKYSAAVP